MRKHRASLHSKKGFSSAQSRLLLVSLLVIGVAGTFAGETPKPFVSSEVKFADLSPSGLQIMPASCPSTAHWSGECSQPSYCQLWVTPSTITASPSDTVEVGWNAPYPPDSVADS